jgi:cytochrome c biogenesis protein CcdA
MNEANTETVIDRIEEELESVKKKKARKNMVFGAIWFAVGLVATLANFGIYFWGAILYGIWQFLQGYMSMVLIKRGKQNP